jgi:segregation and condensation protein A
VPAYTFDIETVGFKGPLELLLDLIEKRKLLVNDVSLAAVTDEYIAYVKALEEHPIPETAQFVYVASTLLLIKSKSLLPILDLTEEEKGSVEELEHRLQLYQLFRDVSQEIKTRFGVTVLYERPFVAPTDPIFVPDRYATVDALASAIRDVLHNLPQIEVRPVARVQKVISLDDMMKRLEERILKQFKTSFKEFTKDAGERGDVIVGFLAVLELVKRGAVSARQEGRFEDIHIERDGVDTPRYL